MLMQRLLWSVTLLAFVIKAVNTSEFYSQGKCLTMLEDVNPKRTFSVDGNIINLTFDMSRRVTHRLVTRISEIFLREVLGFANVTVVESLDEFNSTIAVSQLSEVSIPSRRLLGPQSMINMEVWVPHDLYFFPARNKLMEDVLEVGPITSPGHLGWFIPDRLSKADDTWVLFTKQETASRFDVDDANLRKISNATMSSEGRYYCEESFCQEGMYIPPQCQSNKHKSQPCAILLSDYVDGMKFIKHHIEHWKLYVRVAWVGPNLKQIIKSLTKEYLQMAQNSSPVEKSLVILHWTPSNIIPNEREYVNVEFPSCGSRGTREGCQYDSKRLAKAVWEKVESNAKLVYETIYRIQFNSSVYEHLINKYNEKLNKFGYSKSSAIEVEVACEWLKDNLNYTLTKWVPDDKNKNTLYIGGIFPMTGIFYTAKSIVIAAKMAKDAINNNSTLLRDYNLKLLVNDGQCNSDFVMRSYIDYISVYNSKLVGILGPACSETIEPLAGVSRLYHTTIISYGAEGSSFSNRSRFPYFFRTIGENRQYKYVYLELLKRFNWHRVAAFSEDGQKYTEYISYMQEMLRENGITFVANIKFPRDWQPEVLTKYLEDLKQKRARIIIADVYDKVARLVMCEAYRLNMTGAEGYVWFLPPWLRSSWFDTDYHNQLNESTSCSTAEMRKAVNGYFVISHANFAPDDSIMQEGKTVGEWRAKYEKSLKELDQPTSPYAGYAYDAMWTYALALDKLLKENQSAVFDLHSEYTISKFTQIISKTDFNGLSGRIKFVDGPSRFPVINVFQRVDNETRLVGNFTPHISEKTGLVNGGTLNLNINDVKWLTGKHPDDGSEPPSKCVFSGFAELLNVSCEGAIVIVNIICFTFLGMLLIIGIIVIKRKYDAKVRQHDKYLKSLGLDVPPDTSSLDKWEIPREQVVINRKLGEGAFGTVYGGEALFSDKGWLAVAVKTLKVGSSTEDKLNFLSEVEVMKRFEHKNIIKLLAVCIKGEPVLTVMEFMLYGDLKTYLLARRHLVNDQHYEDSDEISNKKLTAMALDVARALSYLAQLKYVHRDVASRNCLVNAQRVVKLGDFGMTRPMYENDYYKFNRKGMLPVRWMAPESLGLGIFTPASDVWSYGVLLYEIITFGSFPFQGMSNNQVLTHVKSGNSLTVPKGVKPQLEELIKSCWSIEHTKRPTAPEIVDFLATNQRVIAPCLDVPLASVQLEHTGQMEMQLSTSPDRKFSFPWTAPVAKPQVSKTSLPIDAPLLDINGSSIPKDHNIDSILGTSSTSELESTKPLLGDTTDSVPSTSQETAARYVNLQPFMDIPTTESNSYSIPMRERKSPSPGRNNFNNMSFL